jgi:hypothetical protein
LKQTQMCKVFHYLSNDRYSVILIIPCWRTTCPSN